MFEKKKKETNINEMLEIDGKKRETGCYKYATQTTETWVTMIQLLCVELQTFQE